MGRETSATVAPAVVPFALFGIDNSGVGVAASLLVIFLIAVWFALVFWTWADARRRLSDSVLIGSATIAALIFPFAGSLVYAIVRPPETLDDAYERDLDVRAAELRVRLLESAVKGGPGSSAHTAAVGAETASESQARAAQGAQAPRQQTAQPRRAAQKDEASSQRSSSQRSASERSSSERSAQQRRPSSGRPSSGN
jgi:hypothetical protein